MPSLERSADLDSSLALRVFIGVAAKVSAR
jgi:hypothetical protein